MFSTLICRQEKYKGTELRYISHTTFSRDSRKWSRQAVWHGYVNLSKNRAENSNELGGMIEFAYGWHYNWRLADGKLMLKAGGMVDAGGGFLYNTRNGNNPAQARIRLDVRPSAVAKYDFSVRQLPLSVRYEVDFPLAGLMFSPNYGQSYYEIFSRGNYDHNIVSTYVGNAPSVRQMLTLDVKKKRTTLRVGWLGDWQQAKPNNLKQHYYTNALLLGIVKTIK